MSAPDRSARLPLIEWHPGGYRVEITDRMSGERVGYAVQYLYGWDLRLGERRYRVRHASTLRRLLAGLRLPSLDIPAGVR